MSVEEQRIGLCSFRVAGETFGIETGAVQEAFRHVHVHPVPMAPEFVAGVLAYRGEVLTAVNLRAVLGMAAAEKPGCGLVLRDSGNRELFALLIDSLADVVEAKQEDWEPNPAQLDARQAQVFRGAYRNGALPLVRLDAERLQPSWLLREMETSGGRA